MKLYLAGPMSNIPAFNFPAFDRACERLRAANLEIVCDGIIFLPDWNKSRGAKLEAFTGLLTGKKFAVYVDHDGAEPVEWIEADAVREVLRANMP